MRLLKPEWVSLDGKPIFSIDIHPDGSRFATGGQGDNSGKVVVWNMAPVRDIEFEKDDNVPKMLSQMDNHFGCVNCVRWSNSGRFLASGADDKLIMIWQTSRQAGVSSTFGSSGGVVNPEQWRVGSTLRGHSGDVMDLAWSPNDIWLASCSVDNTVIVWNAKKFPEQISMLTGHTGMVKGVTWDPVGKYLASQSDDKTLRIWRTLDWQQETCVKEPFDECGGTTHVLRLHWSPDGQYVVSAHAMNNSGPTAQIIDREGWKTNMDFVGHRKAIAVVRFNPCIFSKKIKKDALKPENFTCCAIGSKDRSLSIWLTALRRPLVVTHELFTSTVLDISWSQNGMELLCCSWDGTVAYLSFSQEEVGRPLSSTEKMELHRSLYGKNALSAGGGGLGAQIVESAALYDIQQNQGGVQQPQQQQKNLQQHKPKVVKTIEPPKVHNGCSNSSSSKHPFTPNNKQIETRTKDGRRRITPIFLAPQPEFGDTPLPFTTTAEPQFSSSKEQSTIIIEKKNGAAGQLSTPAHDSHSNISGGSPHKPSANLPKDTSSQEHHPAPALPSTEPTVTQTPVRSEEKVLSAVTPITSTPVERHSEHEIIEEKEKKEKLTVKRKVDQSAGLPNQPVMKRGPGRPRKDRSQETLYHSVHSTPPHGAVHTPIQPPVPVVKEQTRVVYAASGLNLPTPSIDKSVSIQIAGTVGSDNGLLLEVENSVSLPSIGHVHKVRCLKGGVDQWENVQKSKVTACAGNSHIVSITCEDHSLTVLNTPSGRKLYPSMVLDSKVAVLKCSGYFLMAITSKGNMFVWDMKNFSVVIKNESLVSIITCADIKLERSLLTEQGLPVISLSNDKTYTYKVELGCWVIVTDRSDLLHLGSSVRASHLPELAYSHGPLATLQAAIQRPGSHAKQLQQTSSSFQQSITISYLENQMSGALALKSSREYKSWLLAYVRYLSQEAVEEKLRDVCDDLLGPTYMSTTKWNESVLGLNKHRLLQEVLPIIASNLKLQRLFSEYEEQLQAFQ